jgi:hypothetical protein
MKDVNISVKRQKIELKWLLGCFCLAFLLNITAIIIYKTAWNEVFTQLWWVLFLAVGFYVISFIVRWLYRIIFK